MAETADVVIIGAGVIGASIAHHLMAQKAGKVVLLEAQERPGLGSTRYATGGYRAQFSTAINVKLSLLSREKLRSFQEETGVPSGYSPCGYLFLARRPEQMETLRRAMAVQRAAGLSEVREVSVEEIHSINPWVNTEDIVGGTFCPTDGFTRPLQIHEGYLRSAVRNGASLLCGRQVVEIQIEGGSRVRTVRTQRETIETRVVVNAAGAWAGEVAAMAGVALPVWPARRQVAVSVEQSVLPDTMPMTIDVEEGFHLRVRDGRVLLLWPVETPGRYPYDVSFREGWLEGVRARVNHRVPVLRPIAFDREACYCGLYEMSPDKHVVLGEAPHLKGFYLVNGSSGHGVMHAPILGQLVAEMILFGQARTLEVHALRPARFMESDLNPETGIL
ncbi:MAG TPA: FAD-dependent oxidoreductase [Chthonomonas sp.]|uniref:NAD(P)/FAD-dependent oxidoreductase n=1 Tax=Chthonomonas sp. TaxID=2282153 RepID=UPI002B4B18F6|nr:FAD-dependent oxidoreductase [Chthonomonas sp.]HLI48459.1 FAD-dependent oxidoreductase [Chthonomonas sp.]